jgi:hypothetical protein
MKAITEIDAKELKVVTKELNDSGLIKKKIKIVGAKVDQILTDFSEAIEALPEDADIPASIATFYNDLYADEIDETPESEDADGDEMEGDEQDESDEESDADESDDDQDGEDAESDDDDTDEDDADDDDDQDDDSSDYDGIEDADDSTPESATPPVKPEKKEPKPKAEKKEPKQDIKKKPTLFEKKRAEVNPKLSLKDKVKNILNFGGGKFKQTTYFPLDCETIRQLETNVGMYPSEIYDAIKLDKKGVKRIEKFTPECAIREINKIKSAYSYIVGAIKDEKAGSKFYHIMKNLVDGKDIPKEVAHISTIKVARRALIAYLDVTGVDYSTLKDARKELVAASSKAEKPAVIEKPKAGKKETVVKEEGKKSSKKK